VIELVRRTVGSRILTVVATERADGDMRPDVAGGVHLVRRQIELTGEPWVMVTEDHDVELFDADAPSPLTRPHPLPAGDLIRTTAVDRHLALWAGDCAPLVLCGRNGTLVVAHAGWRGLAAGVVDVAVDAVEATGDTTALAVVGPSIHAECYEFGRRERELVATGAGVADGTIGSTTRCGRPSLDVPATIRAVLARRGVELEFTGSCTACDRRWFSHRARAEMNRHAIIAWTTPR
jgi:copper oxidase (laccase) domain-containing protein